LVFPACGGDSTADRAQRFTARTFGAPAGGGRWRFSMCGGATVIGWARRGAASVVPIQSQFYNFKALWPEACSQEATAAGAAFSMQDAQTPSAKADGTLVVVDVDDYRYVSSGARIAFGIMTGNAFIKAKVTFRD
jgi:hypothetical protein